MFILNVEASLPLDGGAPYLENFSQASLSYPLTNAVSQFDWLNGTATLSEELIGGVQDRAGK